MQYMKKSWEKISRLNPPKPNIENPDKPIEALMQQLVIELEMNFHKIFEELEYLNSQIEKLREEWFGVCYKYVSKFNDTRREIWE